MPPRSANVDVRIADLIGFPERLATPYEPTVAISRGLFLRTISMPESKTAPEVPFCLIHMVGDAGFEPATPAV
jgi:hypothetical protein